MGRACARETSRGPAATRRLDYILKILPTQFCILHGARRPWEVAHGGGQNAHSSPIRPGSSLSGKISLDAYPVPSVAVGHLRSSSVIPSSGAVKRRADSCPTASRAAETARRAALQLCVSPRHGIPPAPPSPRTLHDICGRRDPREPRRRETSARLPSRQAPQDYCPKHGRRRHSSVLPRERGE